jgi:hypothetical protein
VATLAWLLGVPAAKPPARVRTIGLWDALVRVRLFVSPVASIDDLRILADMRDGVVHAAQAAEMEAQVLTAFVQHAEVLLSDLGHERADFWAGQLRVVDALLADASDKVAHDVAVKLEAARASYAQEYGSIDPLLARIIRTAREVSKSGTRTSEQAYMSCPVCESNGIAVGGYDVDYIPSDEDLEDNKVSDADVPIWFEAESYHCRVCGLRLVGQAELAEARIALRWEPEDAHADDVLPWADEDEIATWREEQAERRREFDRYGDYE